MPERNPTSQSARELLLVLGVAGIVLAMTPVGAELRHSHLAARQVPITRSSLVGAEASAAEQEDRLAERTRQKEGMGTMPRVIAAISGQETPEHVCAPSHTPDRDLRVDLAMMAIQQRRSARERATSEGASLVLTEQSVAPPDAAKWAERRRRDPVC
jgi:hypothetical protein